MGIKYMVQYGGSGPQDKQEGVKGTLSTMEGMMKDTEEDKVRDLVQDVVGDGENCTEGDEEGGRGQYRGV